MTRKILAALALGASVATAPALADPFDFKGSFGASGGFTRYSAAVSNPLFNETPYITTEARAIYLHDELPSGFLTGGGHIDAGAIELRAALTDRLGFIAPKDGYVHAHFTAGLKDTTGFENLAFGLKYAVVSDPRDDLIVTLGGTYEPPSGNLKTSGIQLQGHGGGFFNVFAAGAKRWGPLGIEGNVGLNQAADTNHDSSLVHYAAHVDYELYPGLFPMVELNGFSVVENGTRLPVNFDGVDLVNFGSLHAGTVMSAAFGGRYAFNEHLLFGVGYERPITNRQDILGERVYVDLIVRY